jgi:hypothetical protein
MVTSHVTPDSIQANTPTATDLPAALQAMVDRGPTPGLRGNPVVNGYWIVPCNDGCVDGVFTLPDDTTMTCVQCRGRGWMWLAMVDDPTDIAYATALDAELTGGLPPYDPLEGNPYDLRQGEDY